MAGAAQASDVGAHFVHYATAENTGGRFTTLHHPLTDGRQDAIFHVTQNWNPPGASGTYNDSVIGILYTLEGLWSIFNQEDSAMPVGAGFNIWVPPVDASSFVHRANAGSITYNYTVIDHPLTNNNPGAVLRVTQNFNPGGVGGVYNDHKIGVWYDGANWAVFNQDQVAMPDGASFNVTVLPDDPTVSVHTAVPANTTGTWTSIDHPLTNNNPNAIVSITQSWNPGGVGGVYNDHAVGVLYQDGIARWTIFNQDGAPMPDGASFNVSAPSLESDEFVHLADTVNTTAWATYVDHPLSNDNPHALLFVTQNWNPGGAGGIFNDHSIGVWYSDGLSRWTVANLDSAHIPVGASFNVSIPAVDASTFVHSATAGNITLNWTTIDNPVTNGDPDAIVHVTQNWNPSRVGGLYNDHTIGVWYDGAKWAIFNQDLTAMQEGAFFNVSIPADDTATFVHTATAGSIFSNSTAFHHPLTDGNPDAIVRVTQNWNPGGSGEVYNDHEIGVWYTGNDWSIFNQDDAAMPVGASFNITAVDPPLFSDGFESGNTSAWSAAVP